MNKIKYRYKFYFQNGGAPNDWKNCDRCGKRESTAGSMTFLRVTQSGNFCGFCIVELENTNPSFALGLETTETEVT